MSYPTPTPSSPAVAKAALEADIAKLLGPSSKFAGKWDRVGPLAMTVSFTGRHKDNATEETYVALLTFTHYPDWPPLVQFVNPETTAYTYPQDISHLPWLDGNPEIHVHHSYCNQPGDQLVCCSANLKFYLIRHGIDSADKIWNKSRHNLAWTLNTIQRALTGPHYRGRQRAG